MVFLAFCVVALTSCAHDPKLEDKIDAQAQSQPVTTAQERAEVAEQKIEQAPLTDAQKAKLEEISQSLQRDLKNIREEEARLRLLLVKQLVNPKASDREIEAIKVKILSTNQEGNKRWVSALDESRRIIGRRSELDRRFYRAFMQEPLPAEGTGRIQ